MKTNEQLINEIIEKLDQIQLTFKSKYRGDWTKEFKSDIAKIGKDNNFKVYGKTLREGLEKDGGEWLVDLCWTKENQDKKEWKVEFKGFKLALESELSINLNDIIYDFQKLGVIKADIKIMIVQYRDDILSFEYIKQSCEESLSKELIDNNETYLLIGSGPDQNIKREYLTFNKK